MVLTQHIIRVVAPMERRANFEDVLRQFMRQIALIRSLGLKRRCDRRFLGMGLISAYDAVE